MSKTPPTDADFVENGSFGEIRHAIRTNGAMEAKAFLDVPDNARRFSPLFVRLCDGHQIHNEQQFRHLGNGIWELKRGQDRILRFQDGRCWRLTHHYPKKSQKCPPSQIDRASTIRDEHFARGKQGPSKR
jgi:hypothetical protein